MHKVVFLAFEGIELLDLSGPQTAFYEANCISNNFYELSLCGFSTEVIRSEAGTQIIPDVSIYELDEIDTLVIPGGKGARLLALTSDESQELKRVAQKAKRVVSICTGAFLLAQCSEKESLNITTHWAYAGKLKQSYPALNVDEHELYTQDGKYWSSAGITAGIDLSLHLIEQDISKEAAMQVSKAMVVYLKRSGSQLQFSDILSAQQSKNPVIISVIEHISNNLEQDLSVSALADKACLSERQLHRLFVQETGEAPAAFVEKYRMNIAKELILNNPTHLKSVALNVGFKSYDGFRRAFERQFKVSPQHFKSLFLAN